MAIQTILPDASNPIDRLGENVLGTYGPGFASVKLTSNQPTVANRSKSGVVFRSINRYHKWEASITYNEMTKPTFNAVYNFLLEKQSTLDAFFLELPQYGNIQAGTKFINVDNSAGATEITLDNNTNINPGDMFYVNNPSDDTHVKAYMVTRVGSSNNIFISPSLQKKVLSNDGASAVFGSPLLRVILSGDNIEYGLSSNNLYSLSLRFEEALV
jgi:hypothetical protein